MPISAAALLQAVREGLQALAAALTSGKDERLRTVLDFAGRFHRYSLHNQALIASQCPHATYMAGYRTWQKLGDPVRRGERGIRILAPRPSTVAADDGAEEERVAFAAIAVCDVSQLTEPPALPTHRTPLPDDQQARYAAIRVAINAEGIRVEERDDLGAAEGSSAGGVIALRAGLRRRPAFRPGAPLRRRLPAELAGAHAGGPGARARRRRARGRAHHRPPRRRRPAREGSGGRRCRGLTPSPGGRPQPPLCGAAGVGGKERSTWPTDSTS